MKRLLVVAALCALVVRPALAKEPTWDVPDEAVQVDLVEVIDGDTADFDFDLSGRQRVDRVRFIGIDTPETNYSYGNEPECYGDQASQQTKSILANAAEIWVSRDVENGDKNGRLLRYVWIVGTDGVVHFLNYDLVRGGYAEAKTYQPNTGLQDELDAAEDLAVRDSAGLWAGCDASGEPMATNNGMGGSDSGSASGASGSSAVSDVDEGIACEFFYDINDANDFVELFPQMTDAMDPDGNGIACDRYFR